MTTRDRLLVIIERRLEKYFARSFGPAWRELLLEVATDAHAQGITDLCRVGMSDITSEERAKLDQAIDQLDTRQTLKRVTTTGWYENHDGTVTFYSCANQEPVAGETVASWAAVSYDDR